MVYNYLEIYRLLGIIGNNWLVYHDYRGYYKIVY